MLNRRIPSAAVIAVFALVAPSWLFSGPNPQLKITITGATLARPVEITRQDILLRFFYGSGPGSRSSNGRDYSAEPSFIVDWPKGAVSEPPFGLPRYDVEFLTSRQAMNTYRLTYVYDPGTNQGWVYLPGGDDPRYRENTSLMLRGVEGSWFYAWTEWDKVVQPLLSNAH